MYIPVCNLGWLLGANTAALSLFLLNGTGKEIRQSSWVKINAGRLLSVFTNLGVCRVVSCFSHFSSSQILCSIFCQF